MVTHYKVTTKISNIMLMLAGFPFKCMWKSFRLLLLCEYLEVVHRDNQKVVCFFFFHSDVNMPLQKKNALQKALDTCWCCSALSSLIWHMCLFHVLMIGIHQSTHTSRCYCLPRAPYCLFLFDGVEGGSCRNIKATYSF